MVVQGQSLAALTEQIAHTGTSLMETIKNEKRDIERRLDKRMNDKLANVPGYEPPSVSQKLGLGKYRSSDNDIAGHTAEDIHALLKNKAAADDVRRLHEEKTNKVDTESQMRYLEILHKMMSCMAVLVCEGARQRIKNKNETEASRAQLHRQLHEQCQIVQRWIAMFNSSQINEYCHQPITLQKYADLNLCTLPSVSSEVGGTTFYKNRASLNFKREQTAETSRGDMRGEPLAHNLLTLQSSKKPFSPAQSNRLQVKPLDFRSLPKVILSSGSFTDRNERKPSNRNSAMSIEHGSDDSPPHRSKYTEVDEWGSHPHPSSAGHFPVKYRDGVDGSKTISGNFKFTNNKIIKLIDQQNQDDDDEQADDRLDCGPLERSTHKQPQMPKTAAVGRRFKVNKNQIPLK